MTAPAYVSPAPLWRDNRLQRCLAASLALVALADWLFYGHRIGISAMLFLAGLCVCSALANRFEASRHDHAKAIFGLAIALLPLVEDAGLISFMFGAAGAGIFVLMIGRQWEGPLATRALSIVRLYITGPWQIVVDVLRLRKVAARTRTTFQSFRELAGWIVPALLCGVFLMLFASANPLIDLWVSAIDLTFIIRQINLPRTLLWLAVICLTWPFLNLKLRALAESKPVVAKPDSVQSGVWAILLSDGAILRSLLAFNVLFALQTGLDVTYLWAGVALPSGMNYAAYAHRGAYPLMCTALLAAGFVLVALRPGSSAERSPLLRLLVFAWVGQNILLVISAILRLDLYVAAYSLTLLRATAFIWMLLVAAGLLLIVVRIFLSRSNIWLIRANLATTLIALYICSLINFASVIASYNVAHCREVSGQGTPLDRAYLASLGPQAIPAIDEYLAQQRGKGDDVATYRDMRDDEASGPSDLRVRRTEMADAEIASLQDWRAWTFRDARLSRYLRRSRDAIAPDTGSPDAAIER
ncbi:protein of unknown function [Rhizobiales bacterium GAS113]|nr:protein of unknown function [Rhizobiales bacterium GAS113]